MREGVGDGLMRLSTVCRSGAAQGRTLDAVDEGSGEYWIDVNAVTDPNRDGCIARVIVRRLPEMREIFRAEFPAGGLHRIRPQEALAAALASGQQAVRLEQCRMSRA